MFSRTKGQPAKGAKGSRRRRQGGTEDSVQAAPVAVIKHVLDGYQASGRYLGFPQLGACALLRLHAFLRLHTLLGLHAPLRLHAPASVFQAGVREKGDRYVPEGPDCLLGRTTSPEAPACAPEAEWACCCVHAHVQASASGAWMRQGSGNTLACSRTSKVGPLTTALALDHASPKPSGCHNRPHPDAQGSFGTFCLLRVALLLHHLLHHAFLLICHPAGVMILTVNPLSPSAEALKEGDILMQVDGLQIGNDGSIGLE